MKYHAYQIAPEYQESPFYWNHNEILEHEIDFNGIVLMRNRDFNTHCPERFDEVLDRAYMRDWDDDMLCKVLGKIEGKKYSVCIINGNAQSDWQCVFYPTEIKDYVRGAFAAQYFNTGSEWDVVDEDNDHVRYYTVDGYDEPTYAEELFAHIGCNKDDIVIHEFAGYHRVPIYTNCKLEPSYYSLEE